jgi:hypothetical protein
MQARGNIKGGVHKTTCLFIYNMEKYVIFCTPPIYLVFKKNKNLGLINEPNSLKLTKLSVGNKRNKTRQK